MSGLVRMSRESSGAVLVFVALCLPVLIGAGGLIVDVGNWYAHKRHLQVQADAGALAAASRFQGCVIGAETAGAAIIEEAAKYSSVEYGSGPGYNPQVGGTAPARLWSEINSPTFYRQSTPVDASVVQGDPCSAHMIDVKLTEIDLPWWLRTLTNVDNINAQARVEIKKLTTSRGALPIGVPEVGPQKAKAIFVNEATGAVVASANLTRIGTSGGLAVWSNSATPVPVTVAAADIGVRIVLSATSSATCGNPLVDCYGAGTNAAIVAGTPGLSHIRGWSSTPAGTAAAPKVRGVDLLAGSCEDGYFTATAASDPCTVDVSATVDFGGAAIDTVRVLALRSGANANTTVALAPPAVAGGPWTGGAVPVTRGAGAANVELRWQTGCSTNRAQPCNTAKTSLGTVQRAFAGNESLTISGPIKLVQLYDTANPAVPGANSFPSCATCTHDLVVKLGLKPSLQNAQTIGDPIISLKLAGGGSQNQALDCDPAQSNTRDQLANGCGPAYSVNSGQTCPAKSTLWGSPQPWNCVVISTGAQVGQVRQGMSKRILGDTSASVCTQPNHWSSFPDLPPGDPRIVNVMLTPFGAFNGSGGTTVPVTGFATFYVTGWDGGACQGQGDDPAGQGSIVGHYVKYIDTLNPGGGGSEFCEFNSLGSCVAEFTR